jgi:hypothetical protein
MQSVVFSLVPRSNNGKEKESKPTERRARFFGLFWNETVFAGKKGR